MGSRRARARWAVAAAALALAGCVGPAALSVTGPATAPTPAPAHPDVTAAPTTAATVVSAVAASATPTPRPTPGLGPWRAGEGVAGVDVSRYQPTVDWEDLFASGHLFVFVKATEGTSHVSPTHDEQRAGSRSAGLLQGGYHYARPAQSSGTLQARFFHANGGAWSPDGTTLPGALDLEFAESGDPCHGLSTAAMTTWVREFSEEYRRLSGRVPVIYTKAEVWDTCTNANPDFGDHPLWLFDHAEVPGDLPTGWERPTLWQRAVENHLDRNVFFGSDEQLVAWASAPLR